MANTPLPGEDTVLNKSNKQILEKVDGSQFDAAWIINPDLSAVAGKDPKFWKIQGDAVALLSDAEADTDAELVEAARATTINRVNANAESALLGEYASSATGSELFYLSTVAGRLEMLEAIVHDGDAVIPCLDAGVLTFVNHTHEQLVAVFGDFSKHRGEIIQKRSDLLTQAANATTVSELEAINWS